MRVMITGATGFVGFHTAQALLQAGHEVSLLVRSRGQNGTAVWQGTDQVFHLSVISPMPVQVSKALAGCDALVHSAAMVSTHAVDAEAVYRTNVEGTSNVIGTALEMGVDSIIHVSSVTALYDPTATVLDEHSPPAPVRPATGAPRSPVSVMCAPCRMRGSRSASLTPRR